MKTRIVLGIIGGIVLLLALSLGLGWFDVFAIKTVDKAKQNAKREVFEQSQSYVEGKRQEALKLYQEYHLCKDEDSKKALKYVISQKFANVDESIFTGELRIFIHKMKY